MPEATPVGRRTKQRDAERGRPHACLNRLTYLRSRMDNPEQLAYLTTQGRGMETDIPREWIDLVKNNLTDAFRKQDSEGYYTLDLAVMRSEERRVGKECRSRWRP